MKAKAVTLIIGVLLIVGLLAADTSGYLSFAFFKGQDNSGFAQGTFEGTQVGLLFSSELSEKVGYLAELRVSGPASLSLDQAWLRMKSSEAFSLTLGLYLIPFGRYNQSNRPHQTLLVLAPLPVANLYPPLWRDIGLRADGQWGSLSYSAYLGNGLAEAEDPVSGQQFRDNNADKGRGGRVGLSLGRGLEVGYSAYRGDMDQDDEHPLTLQGVDLRWTMDSLEVRAEYIRIRFDNPSPWEDGRGEGFFIQASFALEQLRPVVSYQGLDYSDRYHGPGFQGPDQAGEGLSQRRNRWTLGLVVPIGPNALLKLEYDFNREDGSEKADDLFIIQAALHF